MISNEIKVNNFHKKLTKEEISFRERLVKDNFWVKSGNYLYYQDKSNKIKGNYKYPRYKISRTKMELILGRKLEHYEIVHHKNGDKYDDRIENLELMYASDHLRYHNENRSHKRKKKRKNNRGKIEKINYPHKL